MGSGKIKVAGYSQRVFYNDGIEYRPFSSNLVGQQFTSDAGSTLFTAANFNITTNTDIRVVKNFKTKPFSNFYTLNSYGLNTDTHQTYFAPLNQVKLNLDKTNISDYAYFGSLRELIRVSLENIILNWPASLYVSKVTQKSISATTVEDFVYDSFTNTSSFKVNVNVINNIYNINYLTGGTIFNITTTGDIPIDYTADGEVIETEPIYTLNDSTTQYDLRNLTKNYLDYVVSGETNDNHTILSFTGLGNTSDYIYLSVNGNPFPSFTTTTIMVDFHIVPNNLKYEQFFKSLQPLESYLLNRDLIPKYNALFRYVSITDSGVKATTYKSVIWPTTDGYNLDYNTTQYDSYVGDLIDIANQSDLSQSDLIARYFVSESITAFDTVSQTSGESIGDSDNSGQKITKTLRIYGREFDEVKRYIDGLSDAHTVSYDKIDNTPDDIIKIIAYTIGWDSVQSIVDNDILLAYLTGSTEAYSGASKGLTPIESEIEFWRRVIINSPWIWKSKGTRKAIEFIFKIIGTPEGLLTFKEHVYVAKNRIDMDLFNSILIANGLNLSNIDINNVYILKLIESPELNGTDTASYIYYYIDKTAIDIDLFINSATTYNIIFSTNSNIKNLYTFEPTTSNQVSSFTTYVTMSGFLPITVSDASTYNVDSDGYPMPLPDTANMYFQKGGLWYRETGGVNAIVDILKGNNPHIGPYDSGYAYIHQFEELIPDFSGTILYQDETITGATNIFTNYNSGTVDNLLDPSNTIVYVSALTNSNHSATDCFDLNAYVTDNPYAKDKITNCGCSLGETDDSIRVDVTCKTPEDVPENLTDCDINSFTLNDNGVVIFEMGNGMSGYNLTELGINSECCLRLGFHVCAETPRNDTGIYNGAITCCWDVRVPSTHRTILLFPFITQQTGFDSGLVII